MKGDRPPLSVLLCAVALSLAQIVPTLQGRWSASTPDRHFLGFRYMAGDHFQYAAFIREARDTGSLLMDNPFTTLPQSKVFVFPFFWAVGIASRALGGSIPLAWDLFRITGAFCYVLVFWRFAALFFPRRDERVAAAIAFTFAGGLDWMATLLRVTAVPSAAALEYPLAYFWNWSTFGTSFMPNWTWPALLLMLGTGEWLRGGRWGRHALVIVLPIVWLMHAYTGMVAYLMYGLFPAVPVVGAWLRFRSADGGRMIRNLKLALPALLSFAAIAAYLAWARNDEVFRMESDNGVARTLRFSPAWYPLSYGLLLPFAVYGLAATLGRRDAKDDLLVAWLAASVLLSINPVYAGVKFQYLVFPPLLILAVRGFYAWRAASPRLRRLSRSPAVLAVCVPMLFLNGPVGLFRDLPQPGVERYAFLPEAELRAMAWLSGRPAGPVLCHFRTGNLVPWLAGKPVPAGHWFMTPAMLEVAAATGAFYSPQVPLEQKREVLRRSRARYVYEGPLEHLTGHVDPSLGLTLVYSNGGVAIWEVPRAAAAH